MAFGFLIVRPGWGEVPPHAAAPQPARPVVSVKNPVENYLNGPPERRKSSDQSPAAMATRVYDALADNHDLHCAPEGGGPDRKSKFGTSIRSLHETEVPTLAEIIPKIPEETFKEVFHPKRRRNSRRLTRGSIRTINY